MRFLNARSGNVAMLFGLAAIPFFTMSGMAVDFSRAMMAKNRLGTALDATALALGSQVGLSKQQVEKQARAYFKANYPDDELGKPSKLDITYGAGTVHISATATVDTMILGLVDVDTLEVASEVTVQRNANNLEVAMVLDVTGSMKGSKIADLIVAANDAVDIIVQDDQEPFFTKIAIVPYSMGVNVGSYANAVRGPVTRVGSHNITGATRTNPVVVTAADHGYIANAYMQERIYISGVGGMGELNNRYFKVANTTKDTFQLQDEAGNNIDGTGYGAYSSGGTADCAFSGCLTQTFKNADNGAKTVYSVSTCVTERIGTYAYTDESPTTQPLGRNYPATSSGNPCLTPTITPLTSDRADLHAAVNALKAGGSTGGHIGIAWGWYMLSPNFGNLWPSGSAPLEYGTDELLKIAIVMTDGEYNSSYCQGVISKDSTNGSGGADTHIDCNAANGHAFDQANAQCTAMKQKGITVYTVGFDIVDDQRARDLVNNCATDAQHVKMAADGAALRQAFREIAVEIANLRITK